MTPERLAEIQWFNPCPESTKDCLDTICDLDQMRIDLLTEVANLTAERDKWKEVVLGQQNVICSWCGHKAYREGRTDEELTDIVNEHVYQCEQRPERKLLDALLAIIVPLGVDASQLPPGDVDAIVQAVDERWKQVMALIPEWLPIEAAPKDGTKVLIAWPGIVNMARYKQVEGLGCWMAVNSILQIGPEPPTHYMPAPLPPREIK